MKIEFRCGKFYIEAFKKKLKIKRRGYRNKLLGKLRIF